MDWQNSKQWYNDRIFETFITQDIVDKQNDKISIGAFKDIMPWFMKFGVIHYKHSSVILGEPIAWKVDGDKIKLKVGVHKKFPIHDDIWKEIKDYGELGTASIGGQSIISDLKCDSEKCWNDITKLGLWDVSWVGANPANPGAKVDKVNMMAKQWEEPERMRDSLAKELYGKSFSELTDEQKQKVHNVATIAREKETQQKSSELLQKPFGPWKDWDACMADMKDKYDEETAKKVCGALKRDLEKQALDKDLLEVVKKKMEKEGDQESEKKTSESTEKQVPGEGEEEETVDIKELLADIVRRLEALEGKGKVAAPEEETEEKSALTTPNEVSVKDGEQKEENKETEESKLEKVAEKAVEKILEKHKIIVTSGDKPTQTEKASGSKMSFADMLEKAKNATNMEEYRNGI